MKIQKSVISSKKNLKELAEEFKKQFTSSGECTEKYITCKK